MRSLLGDKVLEHLAHLRVIGKISVVMVQFFAPP